MIRDGVPLAPFTTLELGGPARHFVDAADEGAVVEALRWADGRRLPVALLGGGSNMVVSDAGFDGLVVRIATRGLRFETSGGDATVTAAAGEPWDALVAESVGRGLGGLECLSGIPGLVGATPIQNVGAYGQEVAETIRAVRVLERGTWQTRALSPEDVRVRLPGQQLQAGAGPLRGPGRHLRAAPGRRRPPCATGSWPRAWPAPAPPRRLPRSPTRAPPCWRCGPKKSMLVTAGDPNRRSVGSFFTNPIVEAAEAEAVAARAGDDGASMPRWPAGDGRVKLSAGWLIERAGIARGLRRGPVGVSSAHALALVHHGGGTTAALLALAREISEAVRLRFGVTLVPEPTFVGVAWNLASG